MKYYSSIAVDDHKRIVRYIVTTTTLDETKKMSDDSIGAHTATCEWKDEGHPDHTSATAHRNFRDDKGNVTIVLVFDSDIETSPLPESISHGYRSPKTGDVVILSRDVEFEDRILYKGSVAVLDEKTDDPYLPYVLLSDGEYYYASMDDVDWLWD